MIYDNRIFTLSFFSIIIKVHKSSTTFDITVAKAAPDIPIFGNIPTPNIKSQFITILITTDTELIIELLYACPQFFITHKYICEIPSIKNDNAYVLRYSAPISTSTVSDVNIFIRPTGAKTAPNVNSREIITDIFNPIAKIFSTACLFPRPQYCDAKIETPPVIENKNNE